MFSTYEEYLPMPGSFTLEQMAALHREMKEETGSDTDALDLYGDLRTSAANYFQSRALWSLWSREKKLAEDAARTARHHQVIDCVNILARYLKAQGKAVSWREVLGDEKENPCVRKRIGDFACYLVFVESLNAR
jgi:hypothetical protein